MEIAGVVLGAVPICTAAISQYKTALDWTRHFCDWHLKLPRFERVLRIQRESCLLSVEILLTPCFSEEIVSQMLADPSHANWTSKDTLRALREFHGDRYVVYDQVIEDIALSIAQLGVHIGLGTMAQGVRGRQAAFDMLQNIVQASPPSKDGHFHFAHRIYFAVSKREQIKLLLEEIDQNQRRLDSAVSKSERVPKLRSERQVGQTMSPHTRRRQVMALHGALQRVFKCSKHATHLTRLQLEAHCAKKPVVVGIPNASPGCQSYHIALGSPWERHECDIFVSDREDLLPDGIAPLSSPPARIRIICDTLENHTSAGFSSHGHISLHLDTGVGDTLKGVYSAPCLPTPCQVTAGSGYVSLAEMLQVRRSSQWRKMSRSERVSLAVTISSSMQHLLTTEWLAKPWSKDEILIPVNQQPNLSTSYVVERPYLVHHFAGASPIAMLTFPCPPQSASQTAQPAIGDNRSILIMLGVYIMELWFGKAIENYQTTGQQNTSDVLQSWFDKKRDELPMPLEEAVGTCLDAQQHDNAVAALLPEIVRVLAETHNAWS